MTFLAAEDRSGRDDRERTKRVVVVLGSLALTGLIGWLAFSLGAWGFGYRRFSQHEGRLRRLVALRPALGQVVQGLNDEGSRLIAAPGSDSELRRIVTERGGRKSAEVLAKGRAWPQTRVFLAADMVYFVYFDHDGVMRDFTCVSR